MPGLDPNDGIYNFADTIITNNTKFVCINCGKDAQVAPTIKIAWCDNCRGSSIIEAYIQATNEMTTRPSESDCDNIENEESEEQINEMVNRMKFSKDAKRESTASDMYLDDQKSLNYFDLVDYNTSSPKFIPKSIPQALENIVDIAEAINFNTEMIIDVVKNTDQLIKVTTENVFRSAQNLNDRLSRMESAISEINASLIEMRKQRENN